MRVCVAYRGIPHAEGWATGDHLVRAFEKLGCKVDRYGNYYKSPRWLDSVAYSPAYKPDLLVYLECCDGDPQYKELADWDCKKVYWDFDTALHRDFSQALVDYFGFDKIYMANKIEADRTRSSYMPYAVSEDKFKDYKENRIGAAIIGSRFRARQEFASKVGTGLVSGVYGEDYVKALNRLKVHVHYLDSGGYGMVVARPWETMATGACLLAPRTLAMDLHFMPGAHYVEYDPESPIDCKDKIEHLLLDDGFRKSVASVGQALVLGKHTYVHRAQRILSEAGL